MGAGCSSHTWSNLLLRGGRDSEAEQGLMVCLAQSSLWGCSGGCSITLKYKHPSCPSPAPSAHLPARLQSGMTGPFGILCGCGGLKGEGVQSWMGPGGFPNPVLAGLGQGTQDRGDGEQDVSGGGSRLARLPHSQAQSLCSHRCCRAAQDPTAGDCCGSWMRRH